MSKDLQRITEGWDFEPGQVVARFITGDDGKLYVQMRIDLGVLQMEVQGRPDGRRPHGEPTLLDYFRKIEATASAAWRLSHAQCEDLQKEAIQFYNRQLAFTALEYLEGIVRDTEHILEIIRLIDRRSPDEGMTWPFVQLFPHVRLVHAQAAANQLVKQGRPEEAERLLDEAIREIHEFSAEHGDEADGEAPDLRILEEMRASIRTERMRDPRQRVQEALERAIAEEDFERAAKLRDEIRRMS